MAIPADKVKIIVAVAIAAIVVIAAVGIAVSVPKNENMPIDTEEMEQFLEICKVPRSSGNNEKIGQYLMDFAEKHHLEHEMDSVGNVRIDHPGKNGNVILQTHMDMVAVAGEGVVHNWKNDPIETYIDGGFIRARGTTLGADDGAGMTIALCALKSPQFDGIAFRCIFTVDEESDGSGAKNVSEEWLRGYKYVLNIDSETDDTITVGSAGSTKVKAVCEFFRSPAEGDYYEIEISGLLGGHSGSDIDKGRGNAIILAAELLERIENVRLVSLDGGTALNVIPGSSRAVFAVPHGTDVVSAVEKFTEETKTKYKETDPGIKIRLDDRKTPENAFSESDTAEILYAVLATPNGVLRTDEMLEMLTSSNLGHVVTEGDTVKITIMPRSFYYSDLQECDNALKEIYGSIGAEVNAEIDFYGWIEDEDSELVSIACSAYSKFYGREPVIKLEKAALECGFFMEKCPELMQISIGPNIYDCHTVNERMDIESFAKSKEFVFVLVGTLSS